VFVTAALAATAFAACQSTKSANPLSPQIAGPIAGVSLSAPAQVSPVDGQQINDTAQPLMMTLANPSSNSPRTVTLRFQISTDNNFGAPVFSQNNLALGADGQTQFRMPNKLATGHTYFWRAQADDGADVSDWSAPTRFEILTPIVVGVPTLVSPIGGGRASTIAPTLTIGDAPASGPHGALSYQFQIADNVQFAPVITNAEQPEADGQTSYNAPQLPSFDKTYFWRARTLGGPNPSDWSVTESFKTPAAPAPAPGPGTPGGGSVSVSGDWQSCSKLLGDMGQLSQCVHDAINPGGSLAKAFEVTKRIAWLGRSQGLGLLIKNGGENTIGWQGLSFSVSRVCYPDGHIWKVLSDAGEGGTNGATWSDNDFVDKSLYVPAIDPTLPEPIALGPDSLLTSPLAWGLAGLSPARWVASHLASPSAAPTYIRRTAANGTAPR
jgi:hypothetical protein